jgi:hypothetical protein
MSVGCIQKSPALNYDLKQNHPWLESRWMQYQKNAGDLVPKCLENLKLGQWAINVEYHSVHVSLSPSLLVLRSYLGVRNSPLVAPYIGKENAYAQHALYNIHFICRYKWDEKNNWVYSDFVNEKIDLKTMTRKKKRPIETLTSVYKNPEKSPELGNLFSAADSTQFYWFYLSVAPN